MGEEEEPPLVGDEKTAGEAAKKKKKKPKKKAPAEAAPSEGAAPSGAPASRDASTPDGHERYIAALAAMRTPQGEEGAFWISLSACGIGDKKARKLAEGLKQSVGCSLTSIDLSDNLITDAGATALAAALQLHEVAPRLLSFSLAGNPITADGCAACAKALAARPNLALSLPSSAGATAAPSGSAHDEKGALSTYLAGVDEEAAELSFERATELLTSLGAAEPCRVLHTRAVELLSSVAHGEADEPYNNPKILPRVLRWCSKNVSVLHKLLGCPSCLSVDARPRQGLHRLHTVNLVRTMVRAKRAPLTAALLEAKPCILGRCVDLMLAHPTSAILHAAVLGLANDVLNGTNKPLRLGLLEEASDLNGPSRLARLVWAVLSPSAEQAVCKGQVLSLAWQLHRTSAIDKQLALKLGAEPDWAKLTDALPKLHAASLEGQLCGPPPPRPASTGQLMGEEAQLVAMLQQLGIDGAGLVTG